MVSGLRFLARSGLGFGIRVMVLFMVLGFGIRVKVPYKVRFRVWY